MSEFKPGTVAALTLMDGSQVVGLRCTRPNGKGCWQHTGEFGGGSAYDDIGGVEEVRRLVVLDPDAGTDVVVLIDAIRAEANERGILHVSIDALFSDEQYDLLRGALRRIAHPKPPKPEEPTGLGAVVECVEGRTFARLNPHDDRFPWVDVKEPAQNAYNWTTHGGLDGCTPVRVLSEGVTP